jgi:hypothetical protein
MKKCSHGKYGKKHLAIVANRKRFVHPGGRGGRAAGASDLRSSRVFLKSASESVARGREREGGRW